MGEYAAVKTSVWWDIENCHVPRSCEAHLIAQNMSSALAAAGYTGPITISAYGDTNCVPNHVQHALSSTGIALNHVPAGIKDASDKKILVDMLIWAIDNPPPANYLLISGDRDFSNALHKLVMRRYNILLAQPPNVSQVLTAAAKHVWLWKDLVAGEPPLAESPYISSIANGSVDHSNTSNNMGSDSSDAPHNSTQGQNSIPGDQQKGGNSKADKQYKVKQPRKNQSDNVSKPTRTDEASVDGVSDSSKGSTATEPNQSQSSSSSLPSSDLHDGGGAQVDELNTQKNQPSSQSKKPKKSTLSHQKSAPHDFYHGKKPGVSVESSSKNGAPDVTSNGRPKYQKPQSSHQPRQQNPVNHRPHGGSGNFQSSNSHRSNSCPAPAGHNGIPTAPLQFWPSGPPYHGPPINYPDMSRLNISEYPRGIHNNQGLHANYHPNHPGYNDYSYRPPTQPNMPSNMQNIGHWGANPGCSQPSSDPQGLVRYILGALEVLKTEKIPPTEQYIADCIWYGHGDANMPNFDVKKALQVAMQHQAVVKKKLGKMSFFLGKDENLWKCVNIMDDNAKYPKETLDAVHAFMSSAPGYSEIKSSQSRYQAATMLKKTCLKHLSLAEVLQVLNIIINTKKWFVPHSSGWQPLSFNIIVADATTATGGKA
ncbi:hypothetical protein Zm00014a_000721 [Zea mays]|uniref:Endonuclease or glycosyl hydrolase n=4 Tax=Zea mays TaxID=4577 RepID=A0A8J8XJT0_MAIZE|nr:uncharacterized protein LOC103634414 [Zea mays]ONM60001.1 Putative endonuclease or glycosyl hydrolase [Zea mays]ONM60002.1 Putative endonuclease or glycosyl hydrolase [Zea mays]ONM60003.1 Putative endonuclease or glycosyl hydrolase [Zea mays]ONM60006.1 Putative endonuclease or glycosyl hydrolase [Zea mays]ONM60007.1 Putative endonuclease or glycosyl hydrolase [Zea mays]|eukprot:XP_020397037.1 uncharacterized protein LOC103634414 isoform X1 [Zea mays]